MRRAISARPVPAAQAGTSARQVNAEKNVKTKKDKIVLCFDFFVLSAPFFALAKRGGI